MQNVHEKFSSIYRIIDVQFNDINSKCYLYMRASNGTPSTSTIEANLELVIGSNTNNRDLRSFIDNLSSTSRDDISVSSIGVSMTYYRNMKHLISIKCKNYSGYKQITNLIIYNHNKNIFICNEYSTIEDMTLHKHNLYGVLYVKVVNNKLVPADDNEHFEYIPRIGSFDLEMTSLDPINKKSEPYMASYYFDNKSYIIYSGEYLNVTLTDTELHSFIKVSNNVEVVKMLMKIIMYTDPDVIVGYNIYNADIPIIYHTLGRQKYRLKSCREGPRPYFHITKKLEKKYVNSEHGITFKIPGTHCIDMYAYLIKTLPSDEQSSLKLGDVSSKYIGATKDPLGYGDLLRIHTSGTTEEKMLVMMYCCTDSILTYKLYEHFNVWNFHSSINKICGVDPQRIMSKGSVETTYGLCNKIARDMGVFMDSPNTPIYKPGGGLVLKANSGYYEKVWVLDLISLYPNIAIQHNIDITNMSTCTDTHLRNMHDINKESYYMHTNNLTSDVLCDSRGNMYCFNTKVKAILPEALKRLLEFRGKVKEQIREATARGDDKLVRRLIGDEGAAKTTSNSACGSFGEQSSGNPVSGCGLNDVITTTGKCILNMSLAIVSRMGASIIYGDTDSLFLQYDGDMNFVLNELHNNLPPKIRFKVEYEATKMIMGKKKHYVVRVDGSTKIKGYKAAKSSSCELIQIVFKELVEILLDQGPDVATNSYYEILDYLRNYACINSTEVSYKFDYKGKEYSPNSHKGGVVRCMKMRNVELIPGNIMYVTIVLSRENYIKKYNVDPPIELPHNSNVKYDKVYTLDEVGNHTDVIDVEGVFDTQCKSCLDALIDCYNVGNVYSIEVPAYV